MYLLDRIGSVDSYLDVVGVFEVGRGEVGYLVLQDLITIGYSSLHLVSSLSRALFAVLSVVALYAQFRSATKAF